ncbi:hypothetical protein Bca4012_050981 [Brassica carinata]|uniref:Uncharacterized protein n=1 Tax=Brassica carinata TaxID=52824 RepID=A0A8X7RC19_BRACI|nr:hypothetical protein Bca52824_053664 [Brassica carinata]
MAKKKPLKKKPSGRLPTGATKSPASSPKSSTPDASSAFKSKTKSDSPLVGIPGQTSQSPSPAQEDSRSILAKQIEAIASQTLAAEITHVPSIEADIQIPSSTEATIAPPVIQLPSPADLWKAFSQPPKTGLKTACRSAKPTSSNRLAAPPKTSVPGAHPPAPANPVPPPGTLDRTGSTGSVSHDLPKEAYLWIFHHTEAVLSNRNLAWALHLIHLTLKRMTVQMIQTTKVMSSSNTSLSGTRSVRKPGLEAL